MTDLLSFKPSASIYRCWDGLRFCGFSITSVCTLLFISLGWGACVFLSRTDGRSFALACRLFFSACGWGESVCTDTHVHTHPSYRYVHVNSAREHIPPPSMKVYLHHCCLIPFHLLLTSFLYSISTGVNHPGENSRGWHGDGRSGVPAPRSMNQH